MKRFQQLAPDRPPMFLLHRLVFAKHGSRMRISELGSQFPRNQILPDCYSMGQEAELEIQRRYEYINTVMQEAKTNREKASIKLVELLRARQQIEALKLPTLIEMARDHMDSGMSVVLFVNFSDSLKLLADHLQCNCLIHGEQSKQERDNAIEAFQSNRERLIICNIRSGGVGISLHDVHGGHPRVSIISPSWSAQDLMQALGRIHRAGGKTPALQKMVYCSNTVEEDICKVIQGKFDHYAQLNDGADQSNISIT